MVLPPVALHQVDPAVGQLTAPAAPSQPSDCCLCTLAKCVWDAVKCIFSMLCCCCCYNSDIVGPTDPVETEEPFQAFKREYDEIIAGIDNGTDTRETTLTKITYLMFTQLFTIKPEELSEEYKENMRTMIRDITTRKRALQGTGASV